MKQIYRFDWSFPVFFSARRHFVIPAKAGIQRLEPENSNTIRIILGKDVRRRFFAVLLSCFLTATAWSADDSRTDTGTLTTFAIHTEEENRNYLNLIQEIQKNLPLLDREKRAFSLLFDTETYGIWSANMKTDIADFSYYGSNAWDITLHPETMISEEMKEKYRDAIIAAGKIQTAFDGVYTKYAHCVSDVLNEAEQHRAFQFSHVKQQIKDRCFTEVNTGARHLETAGDFFFDRYPELNRGAKHLETPGNVLQTVFLLCRNIQLSDKISLPWKELRNEVLSQMQNCVHDFYIIEQAGIARRQRMRTRLSKQGFLRKDE